MVRNSRWAAARVKLVPRHHTFATSGRRLAFTMNGRHRLRSTGNVAMLGCPVTSCRPLHAPDRELWRVSVAALITASRSERA